MSNLLTSRAFSLTTTPQAILTANTTQATVLYSINICNKDLNDVSYFTLQFFDHSANTTRTLMNDVVIPNTLDGKFKIVLEPNDQLLAFAHDNNKIDINISFLDQTDSTKFKNASTNATSSFIPYYTAPVNKNVVVFGTVVGNFHATDNAVFSIRRREDSSANNFLVYNQISIPANSTLFLDKIGLKPSDRLEINADASNKICVFSSVLEN